MKQNGVVIARYMKSLLANPFKTRNEIILIFLKHFSKLALVVSPHLPAAAAAPLSLLSRHWTICHGGFTQYLQSLGNHLSF